ncbi:MAG: MerR family DNA-binding transcriptional regulator [Gemmatimonadota bacterium]|nr:MerR family DNA-binding transcriptional regulator [Gemmatimonadota bacterium]
MGMTIGEIATRVGVPTATIRYYEGRGLIPEAPRTRSGYRQYGDEAAERLAASCADRRATVECPILQILAEEDAHA